MPAHHENAFRHTLGQNRGISPEQKHFADPISFRSALLKAGDNSQNTIHVAGTNQVQGGRKKYGNARAVDQPIAALIKDLKAKGLLKSTLLVWGGEFGRTPFAQGGDGRDHNQYGFTIWLAGGGIKGGTVFGETDEWGYKVVKNKVEIHDLHATMLHLLGIDHKRLTVKFQGLDARLTGISGDVVREILV